MASPDKRKVRFSNRLPHVAGATSKVELSIIDQKWGRLFDNKGTPTKRLGQFLRGLANYIIRDFQPKESIVVTPAKMATLYAYPRVYFPLFRCLPVITSGYSISDSRYLVMLTLTWKKSLNPFSVHSDRLSP